jgi:CRP-like cAMP-binding protein
LKKVSELKEGDSFGELALMNSKPRLATIKTITPCKFAILSKDEYKSILEALDKEEIETKIRQLDSIPFFTEYSRNFKYRLLFAVEILEFYKGQIAFKEGSSDQNLYFVINGEFEITKKMTLHSDPKLPMFDYRLLNPCEKMKKKFHELFEECSNLVIGDNTDGIDEVRRFMDKKTYYNLAI